MKIGITNTGYPTVRNILNKISTAKYISLRNNNNLFHTLSTIKKIITKKKLNFEGKYFFYQSPKIDILHLYNDINYSNQKWVSTFETLVPRFAETKDDHQKTEPQHKVNKKTEKGLQQIAKKNCLGVISICKASYNIHTELLKHYPKYQEVIKNKTYILHPPQEIISEKIKKDTSTLHFIFIGNQFHLKGGVEMYEVFHTLRKEFDFKLTIISNFGTDNYVTKVSEEEALKTKKIIHKAEWIDVYENIPNEQVVTLIKNAHVGILPTWSDTYGFSVLEMQACGVPVITTDIRALPEINNNDCGWLIHLPQNRLKQALYFNVEQKARLKNTLKKQLKETLTNIFNNKESIYYKAENAINRIKKEHCPVVFSKKLMDIYTQNNP